MPAVLRCRMPPRADSRRRVVRSRHRTLAAMTAQTVEQGRFLGGRPPYGYRLVDAGPYPNRAHAGWGRRRQRLDPDPVTVRYVRWIFAERLAGRSVARIARELIEHGVPCPSGADPGRNRHRGGLGWNLRSVAVILANPRYTGREVWRRHECAEPGEGRRMVPAEWAVSKSLAHPALVSEADFVRVVRAGPAQPCEPSANRVGSSCAIAMAVEGSYQNGARAGSSRISSSDCGLVLAGVSIGCQRVLRSGQNSCHWWLSWRSCAMGRRVHSPLPSHGGRVSMIVTDESWMVYSTRS